MDTKSVLLFPQLLVSFHSFLRSLVLASWPVSDSHFTPVLYKLTVGSTTSLHSCKDRSVECLIAGYSVL